MLGLSFKGDNHDNPLDAAGSTGGLAHDIPRSL
jgi:hypothetical protein